MQIFQVKNSIKTKELQRETPLRLLCVWNINLSIWWKHIIIESLAILSGPYLFPQDAFLIYCMGQAASTI